MRKTPRKSRRSARVPSVRRPVSRKEYAEVVARLGTIELQLRRCRMDLDLQLARTAQLQLELDAVRKPTTPAAGADVTSLPLPVTHTVES